MASEATHMDRPQKYPWSPHVQAFYRMNGDQLDAMAEDYSKRWARRWEIQKAYARKVLELNQHDLPWHGIESTTSKLDQE